MTDRDIRVDATNLFDDGWEQRLSATLNRQQALIGHLDALSLRQADLIRQDNADRLIALLTERGELTGELSSLSDATRIYREHWADVALWVDESVVAKWEAQITGLARTATAIAERDDNDRVAVDAMKDRLASKLAGLGNGRTALSAYGGPKPSSPAYTDRKG